MSSEYETESEFLYHQACEDCDSGDACAVYDDGHTHCFSCGSTRTGSAGSDGTGSSKPPRSSKITGLVDGEFKSLNKRKITEETCKKWGYQVGTFKGRPVQIANYRDNHGEVVAQKIRFPDKDFTVTGDLKKAGLYGQSIWRDTGRKIVITEGEIDALSVSQLQGNKWPVVSVPNGAQGAKKAIQKSLDWLEGFEEVIFMFDQDEPGLAAAKECAALLTPGKAKLATLPLKDANECLVQGKGGDVIDAIWGAKVYRPDGIVSGNEITVDSLMEQVHPGYETPYPELNHLLRGVRKGELTLFTAGTGIGKSTIVREIGAHFINRGLTIGNVFLEESYQKTAQAYVAIDRNVPLGDLRADPSIITREDYEGALDRMVRNGHTYFYNHFGSLESDNLLSKFNYFASGLSCDFILLDHISIVVSGQESSREGERKDIDRLMTKLRSLIEQTGVGVIAIAHLKMKEGKPHEEGGRVSLNDLRGSGTLKQIPDNIIALERNQQGKDPDVARIRVLKNREFGDLGLADTIKYSHKTGRLLPTDDNPFNEEEDDDEKAF